MGVDTMSKISPRKEICILTRDVWSIGKYKRATVTNTLNDKFSNSQKRQRIRYFHHSQTKFSREGVYRSHHGWSVGRSDRWNFPEHKLKTIQVIDFKFKLLKDGDYKKCSVKEVSILLPGPVLSYFLCGIMFCPEHNSKCIQDIDYK